MAIESMMSYPPPEPYSMDLSDRFNPPVAAAVPVVPSSRTTDAGSTLAKDPYGAVVDGTAGLFLVPLRGVRAIGNSIVPAAVAPTGVDEELDIETVAELRAQEIFDSVRGVMVDVRHDTIVDHPERSK